MYMLKYFCWEVVLTIQISADSVTMWRNIAKPRYTNQQNTCDKTPTKIILTDKMN